MTEQERAAGLLKWAQGLTLLNVLVIFLFVATTALPAYATWKILNDEALLTRLLSTYEEFGNQQSGCFLRHAKQRGGTDFWSIGTGFAYSGMDRWSVNVVLERRPTDEEITSYCATAKLLAGDMLVHGNVGDNNGQDPVHP